MSDKHSNSDFWDRLGIGLSGLCAIHCLFFPVAIALLPLWPVAESLHAWTHPVLFVLIAPTVIFALRGRPLLGRIGRYLLGGLLIVAAAWILHGWIGDWGEAAITMAGSALLVRGHWLNYKTHQKKKEAASSSRE